MADGNRPSVFTIPIHRAFADALVDGIIREQGRDPLSLSRGLILLPTNRAVQSIRDAFVRRAEPAMLLPRLAAIGDADLDESIGAALDPIDDDPVPPAIDPLTRQIMLAKLVSERLSLAPTEAMRLARELGRTRDQLLIERVDPRRLRDVDRETISIHWQSALRQLEAMLDDWPKLLRETGHVDLAERRNRLLDRLAGRWRTQPPPGFVIAAGISSGAPAIAGLMRQIARLPQGCVVLAGLDLAMPEEEWDRIGADDQGRALESHPQYHLRDLLDQMGVARGEVREWPGRGGKDRDEARALFVSTMFAPAEMTAKWSALGDDRKRASGLAAVELDTPAEEAQAIAIALREAVERKGETAALVTPDRDLATRVSALLRRWEIEADDSAGMPLSASLPGGLILALAAVLAEDFAPVPLMALLKHPLVRAGEARLTWLDGVRGLDLALRGPRPAPGLAGIEAHLAEGPVRDWWQEARAILQPLEGEAASVSDQIALLIDVAGALAGDRVWAGQDGRALAAQLAALGDGFAKHPLPPDPASLPQLLRDSLETIAIRPGAGGHPRIFIWGLIEAQLQRADLMILGGLNEGVWPALPAPDPWLAPKIRHELGLPGLERRIGIAAHDLASGLGANRVLLTRARRDARAPTIASRFWLRLATMMGGLPEPRTNYAALAKMLDANPGPTQRVKRPAPCPPLADRPVTVSVTDVDRLAADPFAFYARSMLRLGKLQPLDADADAAWRGSIIHAVLEAWAKEDGYAPGALTARMAHALDGAGIHPMVRTMGLPKLLSAARWVEDQVAKGRDAGRVPLLAEASGLAKLCGVTLKGRADRIDRLEGGGLAIVDYKSGGSPKPKQVAGGYALQLGLIGAIAEAGGYAGADGTAVAFEYWSFARDQNSREFGKVTSPCTGRSDYKIEADAFVGHALGQFRVAAVTWLTGAEPFTAKLAPEYAYNEYDQLMRLEEWQGRDG